MSRVKTFNDIPTLELAIDRAVDEAMLQEIAKGLKQAIQRKAMSNVYNAYSPKFKSRFGDRGGILDESMINAYYQRPELTVEQNVPWQNIGYIFTTGSGIYDDDMVQTIEEKGMYGAPPRPYLEETKDGFVAHEADVIMQKALSKRGF